MILSNLKYLNMKANLVLLTQVSEVKRIDLFNK
jgi:hypothetical protein